MKFLKKEGIFIGVVAVTLITSTIALQPHEDEPQGSDEVVISESELRVYQSPDTTEGYYEEHQSKSESEVEIEEVRQNYWMYCNTKSLNIRSEPTTDSKVVGHFNYRDAVLVFREYDDEWSAISHNGDTCYVATKYLIDTQPDIPLYECIDYNGRSYQLSEELQLFTYETCEAYGITEYYEAILAQMMTETHYVEGLVSPTNDHGLMQINEKNNLWLSKELGFSDFDDSQNSITAGIHIMSDFLVQDELSLSQALSKYNTGKLYDSTEYSDKVIGYIDRLQRIN